MVEKDSKDLGNEINVKIVNMKKHFNNEEKNKENTELKRNNNNSFYVKYL